MSNFMRVLIAKTRRWGNSTGVILPKELGILPDEEITLHIDYSQKFTKVKDIFGTIKIKKPTHQISKELDREME